MSLLAVAETIAAGPGFEFAIPIVNRRFQMKIGLLISIALLTTVSQAEPNQLMPNTHVCGVVVKMGSTHSLIRKNSVVELLVDGRREVWELPVDAEVMTVLSTAFMSGQKFCASALMGTGNLMYYRYTVERQ